jgi:general secretion pathway protein D
LKKSVSQDKESCVKASACFHQGILAAAMIVSLAVASPVSYGQTFAQTSQQQYETNSPQHWLGQARQMMAERRLEVAQQYIQLAESLLENQPNAGLEYTPEMARQQLRALMAPETAEATPAKSISAAVNRDDLQSAGSALLSARQALAVGDVETAAAQITAAKSLARDFSTLGDSPQMVEQLLEMQNKLADMRAQADPDYNQQAAGFLLAQAKTLIQYKDVQTSRMLVEQAQQFQVPFTPEMGDPEALLRDINAIAGIAPESVAKANDKKNALSLLSRAQLAIDQKRWADASQFVNQAKAIGLADNDYDVDQVRPWQLELKIQNGQKSGVAQPVATDAPAATQFDPNVANADFIPSRDLTKNVTTLTDDANAMALFESGVKAINANDRTRAGELFRLAQQRSADLTPAAKLMIQNFTASESTPMRDENVKPAQAQTKTIDLNKVRSEQQAAFRRLQSSIYKERADAEKLLEKSPNQALAKLTAVRAKIASANLAPETQRPLLTLIERDITEIQAYIEENLSEILNEEQNQAARELVERRAQRRVDNDEQIAKLVDEYNTLIDERRFDEAGLIVRQATELAPDLEVVAVMDEKYRAERNFKVAQELKSQREQQFLLGMQSVERSGIPFDERNPLQFGPSDEWTDKSGERLKRLENARYSSDSERDIWNTLRQTEVEGEYVGTLAEAMGQLSRQAAVNIVFDNVALDDANIQTDQLINVPLTNPVKLENALNIILGNARLTFSVENEVIKVTTPESKRGKTKAETYYIGRDANAGSTKPNGHDLE